MSKFYTDIDDLLDQTREIAEEATYIMLSQVEIDKLLEKTRDW